MNSYWGILLVTMSFIALIFGCEEEVKRSTIIVNEVQEGSDPIEKREIKKIYNKGNLAKAQLYRLISWLEASENVSSADGLKSGLAGNISNVFSKQDNLIEDLMASKDFLSIINGEIIVQEIEIINVSDTLLTLIAIVKNKSRKESNSEHFQTLRIEAELLCSIGALPLFTEFKISNVPSDNFSDKDVETTVIQNQALSTIHYWMGLLEELEGKVAPFQKILGSDFQINFSTGTQISSLKKMDGWLNSRTLLLIYSQYDIYKVNTALNEQNQIVVTFEVKWKGVTSDNNLMTATTNQRWILNKNGDNSFPLVVKIDVEQATPFKIVNS